MSHREEAKNLGIQPCTRTGMPGGGMGISVSMTPSRVPTNWHACFGQTQLSRKSIFCTGLPTGLALTVYEQPTHSGTICHQTRN